MGSPSTFSPDELAAAGFPHDAPLWVVELVLSLRDPIGFSEVITGVDDEALAATFERFSGALQLTRSGELLAGPELSDVLEVYLVGLCAQCQSEAARRGVILVENTTRQQGN